MNYFGLLDCNSFFVSCERLFRPDLAKKPTLVLSSNDGCVVARSKEVKELGISMGVPFFKVKDIVAKNDVAVFSSNFPLYRDISNRVMMALKEEVGVIEQYSVDEAFFAVNAQEDTVLDVLLRVKNAVEMSVGIPVSVGAANTKTIAKYASEIGKKLSGTAFLHDTSWYELTNELPMHEIWGIGRKTTEKMRLLGILTVSDFLATDRARVERLFGIGGLRMRDELSERSVYPLGTLHEVQKSIMSTRSFKKETTDPHIVEDAIAYHVAHAAEELREVGMKAGYISILARTNRHGDWFMRGGTNETILQYPTSDTRVLIREALKLFRELHEPGVPYKKAGVILGMFSDAGQIQQDLFALQSEEEHGEKVMQTIDALNKKFGSETITVGRSNKAPVWKASKAHISPCYTTNWSEIREIQA